MAVSNAESVVLHLRAGGAVTVVFNQRMDLVTVATDGTADVVVTTDGSQPTVGGPNKVTTAAQEGSFACPGANQTVVKAISSGSPQISLCSGLRALSLPPRDVHGKRHADD